MLIRRLTIVDFRCIETMEWKPSSGVNCLIGPGVSGKSSVLDAIALLLAPYTLESASELDYRDRNTERGFLFEAVFTCVLDDPLVRQARVPPMRGWKDGELTQLPDEDGAEAALVCEVRGDANLDLTYSILPLVGDPVPFTPSLRGELALARIAAADRANRDLRLGKNSLLARYFKGPGFGGALTDAVRGASDEVELPEEIADKLNSLKTTFGDTGLPNELQFGLLPAIGWSLSGMVALSTGAKSSSAIPIANAGSGTRNLSLLELSAALSAEHPIVVIDEPERGLEPYRQRKVGTRLVELIGTQGQAFLTTHAPALLSSLRDQPIWHIAAPGAVEPIAASLKKLLEVRPDTFFARLPILCEGPTEIGLLSEWLPPLVGGDLASLGVELVDGGGQPHVLSSLEAIAEAKIPCAGFLDNEAEHSGRRNTLSRRIPCFQWANEKDIEDALAQHLTVEGLSGLVEHTSNLNGIAETTYYAQIRDQLKNAWPDAEGTSMNALVQHCGEEDVRNAFGRVMSNYSWFKTVERGKELARYLNGDEVPQAIKNQIDTFGSRLKVSFDL